MIASKQIAFGGGKRKPYDAEIEYLESTGTQYIDTGIVCSDSLGIEIDLSILELNETTFQQFFGSYEIGSNLSWGGWSNNITQYAVGTAYNYTMINNPPIPFRSVTSINYLSDGLILVKNPELSINVMMVYTYDSMVNDFKFMLFGGGDRNGVTSYDGKCKIHRATITDGVSVILDLIPVRVGDVGYMYDKVSGKLFGNAGTGAFVLGPDIIDYTAKDYIQDGLIAMWDGIENAGWGVHDEGASAWLNLQQGELSQTLEESFTWGPDYLWVKEGKRSSTALYPNNQFMFCKPGSSYTFEVVYKDYVPSPNSRTLLGVDSACSTGIRAYKKSGIEQLEVRFNGRSSYYGNGSESIVSGNHHILITSDGTTPLVFLDGKQITLSQNNGIGTENARSGAAYFAWNNPATHSEKYCRIAGYSRAFTANDAAYHYSIDKARFNI